MTSSRTLATFISVLALVTGGLAFASVAHAASVTNFESDTIGSINGQGGWTFTGPYDAAVVDSTAYGFASSSATGVSGKALRMSDAVTSGSFGDWVFAAPLTDSVGEVDATDGGYTEGTKATHFEVQFDLGSVSSTTQPGMHLSVSPDRGDGSRMSYLRFEDQADGIHVFFDDVQGTSNPANFVETDIATLNRASSHRIKLTLDAVDGPSNDVVDVYIDGTLVHAGTSWENYYRYDSESAAEHSPRIIKTVIFQARGAATPADANKGFLIDNVSLTSGGTASPVITAPSFTSVPVTNALAGVAYSYSVATAGTPSTITATTMPAGLTFADNGNGTATISGAPTTVGSYPVTLSSSNPSGSASQSFTLVVTPAAVWVDGATGNDSNDGSQASPFATIKKAVDSVNAGATINIDSGTYPESVQLTKSVTLVGQSGAKPVLTGSASADYILEVNGVHGGATINNLAINGNGATQGDNALDYGIFVTNSGTNSAPVVIENTTVKNIWNVSANGVEVDAGSYAAVHDSTISSFDKRGIRFIDSSGKVYNDEVIGDNVDGTSRVQNLVNLWGGSTVEIYGNKLHNALTTGTTPTWDSPAIFVSSYGGTGDSTANIHDNEIYASDTGVTLGSFYASIDHSSATITNNNFHDLNTAINFEKSTVTATITGNTFVNDAAGITADDGTGTLVPPSSVDATKNWWGAAAGPGTAVYTGVSFSPWYADAAKTTLAYTTTTGGSTTTATTGSSDTTLTGTSTEDGSVTVTADIASGTTIQGDSSWDGSVSAPTASTATVTVSGFNTSVSSAVAIGSSLSDLLFDKAVKLTFAGQAGTHVGWYNHAGNFTEIAATCSGGNDEASQTASLAAAGSCKMDAGSDLVVWTKHFSTFVTYSQSAIPAAVSTRGFSGGGGGGGNGSSTTIVPGAGTVTTSTGGQVLGASTYNFSRQFGIGSRGEDTTQLQTVLIADGYLTISTPTGYFGPLTRAAVVKYQKAQGILGTGYVGPRTLVVLNAGTTPSGVDEKASLQASLKAQIASLQTQLAQMLAAQSTTTATTTH